jgi:hypothetical protein
MKMLAATAALLLFAAPAFAAGNAGSTTAPGQNSGTAIGSSGQSTSAQTTAGSDQGTNATSADHDSQESRSDRPPVAKSTPSVDAPNPPANACPTGANGAVPAGCY